MLKEVINSIIEAEKKAECILAEAQADCDAIISKAEENAKGIVAAATEQARRIIKSSRDGDGAAASGAGQKGIEAGNKELDVKEREYAKNLDKAVKKITEELVNTWQ